MILTDHEFYKLDAKFNKDNYLVLSVFRTTKDSFDWAVKTISLSPEVQGKLFHMMLEKQSNPKGIEEVKP